LDRIERRAKKIVKKLKVPEKKKRKKKKKKKKKKKSIGYVQSLLLCKKETNEKRKRWGEGEKGGLARLVRKGDIVPTATSARTLGHYLKRQGSKENGEFRNGEKRERFRVLNRGGLRHSKQL